MRMFFSISWYRVVPIFRFIETRASHRHGGPLVLPGAIISPPSSQCSFLLKRCRVEGVPGGAGDKTIAVLNAEGGEL